VGEIMNREPLVYIIILNYNTYEETLRCLESVTKIEYENYKIVVVDNNSVDNSAEVLRHKAKEYIFIANDSNLGYAKGNNIGINLALEQGADYICILNNDVEVEKNFLCRLITYMERDKKVGIAGPCICDFEERGKIQSMGANLNLLTGLAQGKMKNYPYSKLSDGAIKVDYLGGACFVIRSEIVKNIGIIPEMYFLFFEETEFCLKAKRAGYKLMCLKDSRVYHKRSATISKYKGLSYYFLNRNRVVFMRRNANTFQKVIFSVYLFIEAVGRIILKREPISLLKIYYDGLKADKNSIPLDKVKQYIGDR
jgi:GT2 family glycosyltransferase